MADNNFKTEAITSLNDLRNRIWLQNGQQIPSIFRVASYMGFIADLDHSTPERILLKRPGVEQGIVVNANTGLFNCTYKGKHYSGDVFDLTNLFPQYFIHFYDEAKQQFEQDFLSKNGNDQAELAKKWYVRWFSLECYRWFQIIHARNILTKLELRVNRYVSTYVAPEQRTEAQVSQEVDQPKVIARQVTPTSASTAGAKTNTQHRTQEFKHEPIRDFLHRVLPDEDLRIETWLKRMGFVMDQRKSSVNSHVFRSGDQKIIVMTDPYHCYNDRTRKGFLDVVSLSYDLPLEFSLAMRCNKEDPTRMWYNYGKQFDKDTPSKNQEAKKKDELVVDEDRLRFNKSRYTYTGTFYDPVNNVPYNEQLFTYLNRFRSIPTTAIKQLNDFMGVVYDELDSVSRTGADAFGLFYNDYYWDVAQCQAYANVFQDARTLKRPNLKEETKTQLAQRIEQNKQIIQQGVDRIEAILTKADSRKAKFVINMMEKLAVAREWPIIGFPVVKIPKEVKVVHESIVDGHKVQRREYNYTHPKNLSEMELCGYELKTKGLKHNAARTNTTEGVWMACKVPFADVRRVFFFESAIDAMSFIEVDRRMAEAENRTPRFDINQDMLVSVAGQFSVQQGYTVKKLVPQAEVFACFDTDPAGRRYTYELNNIWSKQVIRESKVRTLFDAVEIERCKLTPDFEKKMADNGYKRVYDNNSKDDKKNVVYNEQGVAVEMARFEKYEMSLFVIIDDKEARMSMNDISIFRVREQLPQYELALKVLQPIKAEYMDYDANTKQLAPKTVKDWNDRLVCDRWEKNQRIKGYSTTAGKVRQAEEKKQQAIDDRINKANEKLAQRNGQGGDANDRKIKR